jgi:hypothetical protein
VGSRVDLGVMTKRRNLYTCRQWNPVMQPVTSHVLPELPSLMHVNKHIRPLQYPADNGQYLIQLRYNAPIRVTKSKFSV